MHPSDDNEFWFKKELRLSVIIKLQKEKKNNYSEVFIESDDHLLYFQFTLQCATSDGKLIQSFTIC